jgi:DNA polymerase phi
VHSLILINNTYPPHFRASEFVEQCYGPDIAYSLIRLTRGLASPREGARQGFALALTELLANMHTITVDLLITFIDDACPFITTKEQEDPSNIIGRVLGYMCIIGSGIISRDNASVEDRKKVIDGLIKCSERKSYMKEICYHAIIESLPQLRKKKYERDTVEYLIGQVLDNGGQGIQNSDGLNLALAIQEQYPGVRRHTGWKSLFEKMSDSPEQWKNPLILHPDNLTKIAECLQARPKKDPSDNQNPESQLHSVWNRILSIYANNKILSNEPKRGKIVAFNEFWKAVVDEGLFDKESTRKRRLWGFQCFEKALQLLPKEQVESLFTPNFMRLFTNNLADKSNPLNDTAAHTVTRETTILQIFIYNIR